MHLDSDSNSPHLHLLSTGEDTLHSETSELARVVLHLCGNDSAALAIQLCTPVRRSSRSLSFAVKLKQRFDGDVGFCLWISPVEVASRDLACSARAAANERVYLGTDDHLKLLLFID